MDKARVNVGSADSGSTETDRANVGSARTGSTDTVRSSTDRGGTCAGPRSGRHPLGAAVNVVRTGAASLTRRFTHAGGADESGLGKLIELHAVNSAGDMLITVPLASTIVFSVPTGEARGRVALYLLLTTAPFALLAPVIGPLLDRVPHGRRAARAAAMLARSLLALTLARAVETGGLELYPAALGVLVSSKAYGVVRSAIVPQLLPGASSLVRANSRVTLAGLLATGAAAPAGAGLHHLGGPWPLYGACAVFLLGTAYSFALPRTADSAKGERAARIAPADAKPAGGRRTGAKLAGAKRSGAGERDTCSRRAVQHPSCTRQLTSIRLSWTDRVARAARTTRTGRTTWTNPTDRTDRERAGLRTVGTPVRSALVANAALRCLSGLLTFFLAFLLRHHPTGGLSAPVALALVAVAAGGGNALGTAIGAWLKARAPEAIIAAMLGCGLAATTAAATLYANVTLTAVAATAGIAQALGKLSLDALIQRDVPEEVPTSAFARSESLMQLSWVMGGGLGISLPLIGPLGLAVAACVVTAGTVLTLRGLLRAARRQDRAGTTPGGPRARLD